MRTGAPTPRSARPSPPLPPATRVLVAASTYAGGFTIAKDLTLTDAGPARAVIRGGGPVITVGVLGASTEPTREPGSGRWALRYVLAP